jgi:hypothetical protein
MNVTLGFRRDEIDVKENGRDRRDLARKGNQAALRKAPLVSRLILLQ